MVAFSVETVNADAEADPPDVEIVYKVRARGTDLSVFAEHKNGNVLHVLDIRNTGSLQLYSLPEWFGLPLGEGDCILVE